MLYYIYNVNHMLYYIYNVNHMLYYIYNVNHMLYYIYNVNHMLYYITIRRMYDINSISIILSESMIPYLLYYLSQ